MPAAGLRQPVSDLLFRQERDSQKEAAMPARETERYDSRNWLYASTWRFIPQLVHELTKESRTRAARGHPQLPPVEARVRVHVPIGVERVDDPDERLRSNNNNPFKSTPIDHNYLINASRRAPPSACGSGTRTAR